MADQKVCKFLYTNNLKKVTQKIETKVFFNELSVMQKTFLPRYNLHPVCIIFVTSGNFAIMTFFVLFPSSFNISFAARLRSLRTDSPYKKEHSRALQRLK